MRRKVPIVPEFKSEKAEAKWWDQHRPQVEAGMRDAIRGGKAVSLKDALARTSSRSTSVTLRLPTDDIAATRRIAESKGIDWQDSSRSSSTTRFGSRPFPRA